MSDTAQEGYLTVGVQSAKGTAASTMTTGVRVTAASLSGQTDNLLTDPEIGGGRDRESAGVTLGGFSVGGSLDAYARMDRLGFLLLGLGFEEVATPVQDGSTGAYTHTFTPAAAGPSWLTFESSWGRNRAVRRLIDCIVNELSFSVSGNDWATYSASIVGITEEWRTSPVVPVFASPDPVADWKGSRVELDGLGTYRFTEMGLTVANNASDDEYVIGSRTLVDVTPGAREVSFTGTVRLDGSAPAELTNLYRAAMYGSKTATAPGNLDPYHTSAKLTFGSGRTVGTSTDVRFGVEFELPDVVLNAFPLESSGADVIEASIEGNAFANGVSPVATIKLFNARSTKYAA